MCGLAGYLDIARDSTQTDLARRVTCMAETLRHRGPDDGGIWVDPEAGVAMGFRRLSVVDLSEAGHQPMPSSCGRYVIVFNGEIYNFKNLRQELVLLGHRFRGHSDTEAMLEAVSQWGLETAIEKANGMFAFALWDRRSRVLHLVRDRLGEKPLYYGRMKNTFLFGSELKALRAHPDFDGTIDRDALTLYLRHNCIPGPYTIYKNIHKLPPATILTIDTSVTGTEEQLCTYWSVWRAVKSGQENPFVKSDSEAIECLEVMLREAVKLRMTADVPLGAFLSGGIDSSTIAALMQSQSNRSIQTFSIGLETSNYDEGVHARTVAQHLGTAHTELVVTAEEAMATIPLLPSLYDEPFSDSSQIPTFLVSKLARQHVTVSLSGDGGDELFGGYTRHLWAPRLWKNFGSLPKGLRGAARQALNTVPPRVWDSFFHRIRPRLPKKAQHRHPGDKLQKLAEVLTADDLDAVYMTLVSHWKEPASIVHGARELPTILTKLGNHQSLIDGSQRMMYLDTVTYLPDDILVKLDRASMAVSLEARVPLLDHNLVEFAWRLPASMKIRGGKGKWVLRQVLQKYLPQELIERPKTGFAVPLDAWLRGPLRDWAESLLNERRLQLEGFLDPSPVRQKWKEHLCGERNWQYPLWDVLMFEAWLDESK